VLWITSPSLEFRRPFFHPHLADIKHDHRTENGKLIGPVIEITGYPGLKEIASPTPALLPQTMRCGLTAFSDCADDLLQNQFPRLTCYCKL
jgi:hypothetical protein